ncbi:hypothetical protein BN1058_01037 [Paraliobacillus sp. PM-2]|uniref:DUF5634 family protein n=1 Tax=Paraliobacillus sp. PM-2 TaxID=1462524 RepID=UPI00061C5F8D|nr:DUF5634 family protein [Paraliobacillus sp. PM-2]CQR46763.1 hypothetical protein BN1058_01037 [Paraliobacillus sp. PM-2]
MELLPKQQIINQLHDQLPIWKESCTAEHISIFEQHYNEVLCHLGYKILKKEQIYEVYLPYLKYDTDKLIALTPIWTITHVNTVKSYQKKGYEFLQEVIHALEIA